MSYITNEEIHSIQSIFNDEYTDPFQRLLQAQAYLRSSKQRCLEKIVFVTINPKPDIKLQKLMTKVDSFVKRSIVIEPLHTYEQRGETLKDIGKGFHAHILFNKRSDVCPKQYSNYINNTFKDLVGNTKSIHIAYYPKSFREDKIEYLKGNKWDIDKIPKSVIDKAWRNANNLKSLY